VLDCRPRLDQPGLAADVVVVVVVHHPAAPTGADRQVNSNPRVEPRCPDMVRSFLCGTRGVFRQELVAIS